MRIIEEWVNLSALGYPDYSVSNLGMVLDEARNVYVSQSRNQRGFVKVNLFDLNRRRSSVHVSRLVAHSFIPGRSETFDTPIHLDGNKEHTFADNLAWRPRWFAFKYHAQFSDFKFDERPAVEDRNTGEAFESPRDAAVKYGLLKTDVYLSAANHQSVFPTNQMFDFIHNE